MTYTTQPQNGNELNRLYEADQPVHEWYRFVLSFPPHLVRKYIEKFSLERGQIILDPFCGTGTTLVEAKKLGIASVGVEASAMAHFAADVKTDWALEPAELARFGQEVANRIRARGHENVHASECSHVGVSVYGGQLRAFDAELSRLLIKNSISPLPLHKVLTLLDGIEAHESSRLRNHAKLALAKQTVTEVNASKKLNYRDRRGRRGFASVSEFVRLCRMQRLAESPPFNPIQITSVSSRFSRCNRWCYSMTYAPPWRQTRLCRGRSSFLFSHHDPHRADSRRAGRTPGIRRD